MGFVRRHLTYANVVASLALFLALGGAAFAATQLPRNSVGTGQLKPGAVTAGKIAKKTRNQLRGDRGPQGPQGPTGKTGKTGAKGATGAAGAKGAAGADGIGPAFEVFGTNKAVPGLIVVQTLPAGSYAISANVTLKNSTASVAEVGCTVAGSGEMTTTVPANGTATLSASVLHGLSSTAPVELTCATSASGLTSPFSNMIATQVKSVARAAG